VTENPFKTREVATAAPSLLPSNLIASQHPDGGYGLRSKSGAFLFFGQRGEVTLERAKRAKIVRELARQYAHTRIADGFAAEASHYAQAALAARR